MGVFASGGLDFATVSQQMGKTILSWMNATVQIVDPNTGDAIWDPFTNTETGGEPTVLWQGPARIQHLKSETLPDVGFSQTSIRGIRVQIPLDPELGFIRKGLQVIVMDGGSDPQLEQLQFVITSAINSSYAWIRTLECEVDVKSVADSTWSSVAGSVLNDEDFGIPGVKIRTFHHEDNQWLLDYETTTDVNGNYEIPADAGVEIVVVAYKSGYITQYYNEAAAFETATPITPVNHEETQNINFVMVEAV